MSKNVFFFFRQKTAYVMRISDWSSDVCSSDLKAASGMSLEAFRLIDGSSAASLTFTGTPAVRLGDASLLGEALDWGLMGLAAETTGIMETLNRATFEYLRTRKQCGTTL